MQDQAAPSGKPQIERLDLVLAAVLALAIVIAVGVAGSLSASERTTASSPAYVAR